MSKTIRSTVTFDLKMVFRDEAIKDLQETREQARELIETNYRGRPVGGSQKAMIDMFASAISDEELLERIIRAGLRQFIKEDLAKELSGEEGTSATVGNVKVDFKEPMKPRVEISEAAKAKAEVIQEAFVRAFGEPACGLHDASKACTALCKRFEVTQ